MIAQKIQRLAAPAVAKTACFTGHRQIDPVDLPAVRIALERMIAKAKGQGYTRFISGMAIGVDQAAAALVCRDPDLELVAAVPCPQQGKYWDQGQRDIWQGILDLAHHVEILYPQYWDGCLPARNKWMLNNSDLVLAIWDGSRGGTSHCIGQARMRKMSGIVFDPRTATYHRI